MVNIPCQSPNAFPEQWARSEREECLDRLIIFNECRPHQGLEQDSPLGLDPVPKQGPIRCRNVLDGVIRGYHCEAA
jgi:hypothetical protein